MVKPGLTSASRARAVHQLGAVASRPRRAGFGIGDLGFVGRAESLRIPDPESLRIPNPESRIPASVRRRAAGGTSVRSDRCRTSDTSLAGSTAELDFVKNILGYQTGVAPGDVSDLAASSLAPLLRSR